MNERLRRLPTYPMVALERFHAELVQRGVRVFDFGTGDPVEPTAPAIREALLGALQPVSQYPSVTGQPELRRACADYLQRRFRATVDPERAGA